MYFTLRSSYSHLNLSMNTSNVLCFPELLCSSDSSSAELIFELRNQKHLCLSFSAIEMRECVNFPFHFYLNSINSLKIALRHAFHWTGIPTTLDEKRHNHRVLPEDLTPSPLLPNIIYYVQVCALLALTVQTSGQWRACTTHLLKKFQLV